MTDNLLPFSLDEQSLLDVYNNTLCGNNGTSCLDNSFVNITSPQNDTHSETGILDMIITGVTATILGLMILVTVVGNVFVIAAILLEKHLQNVANYLIVSLAVADLMVACLVMPLGAVYVISKDWVLGPELCDMWTSCDVLCCTASILHLVAIAVDRYWAVTDVDYIHTRSVKKIGVMILFVWLVALVVSLAPQFGWKDPDYLTRINEQKCLVSQDVAYQVFATCSTFYVPLFVILVLYWKIFQAARRRIRRNRRTTIPVTTSDEESGGTTKTRRFLPLRSKQRGKQSSAAGALETTSGVAETQLIDTPLQGETSSSDPTRHATAFTISKSPVGGQTEKAVKSGKSPEAHTSGAAGRQSASQSRSSVTGRTPQSDITPAPRSQPTAAAAARALNPVQAQREKKESLEAKRERKAAKTLAIITGAFVICWLPFFITAIVTPIFGPISDHVANFILWLGYFNSTLNPVIYTIFSPEFRQAFQKILFGGPGRRPQFRFRR